MTFNQQLHADLPIVSYLSVDSSVGAVVENNHFHDGYARIGPFKSIGGIVRGNLFDNSHFGGVLVTPDFYFMEGNIQPRNIVVEDNVFRDCGDPSVFVCSWCQNITLRNNTKL